MGINVDLRKTFQLNRSNSLRDMIFFKKRKENWIFLHKNFPDILDFF